MREATEAARQCLRGLFGNGPRSGRDLPGPVANALERHRRDHANSWRPGRTQGELSAIGALVVGANGGLSDALTLQLLRATAPSHTIDGPRRTVYRNSDGRDLGINSIGFVKHRNGAVQEIERDSSCHYLVEWGTERRIPVGPAVPYWILEDARR